MEEGIASIESDLPEALPVFSDLFENRGVHGIVEGSEQWLLLLPRVHLTSESGKWILFENF